MPSNRPPSRKPSIWERRLWFARGIYELSGDRLRICVGFDRPKELAADADGTTDLIGAGPPRGGRRARCELCRDNRGEFPRDGTPIPANYLRR